MGGKKTAFFCSERREGYEKHAYDVHDGMGKLGVVGGVRGDAGDETGNRERRRKESGGEFR